MLCIFSAILYIRGEHSLGKASRSLRRPSFPLCAFSLPAEPICSSHPSQTPGPGLWDFLPAPLICSQGQRQTGTQGNMRHCPRPASSPLPLFPPVLRNPSCAGTELSFHACVPLHKLFNTKALPPTVSTPDMPIVCKTAWMSPPLQSLLPSQ